MVTISLFDGIAFALDQNEASASAQWNKLPLYQGGNGTLTISFVSNSSDELTVYRVGVHFDWMVSDTFVGLDLSANPVNVTSHGSCTFNPMMILIPSNTSLGSHSFFIGIDGFQGLYHSSFSWNSTTFTMQVEASDEKVFTDMEIKVSNDIGKALNTTYESPEAQSLLTQAVSELVRGRVLGYRDHSYQEGIVALQNATSLLNQANEKEQLYTGGGDQSTMLLIIVGVAIVAVVVILLVVLLFKRRRKPSQELTVAGTEPVPTPQPVTAEATPPSKPITAEVSKPGLGKDTVARLEKLKELRDKNLITKEEYEKKKDEILEQV
jgi:LPXTG-motif cell wall-anchored protein